MDIYDLQSFLTVVEKGNFSRAAQTLALTQPALSQRIKQLEAELGYALLIRRKGCQNIELTSQGACFLKIAEQMLSLWNHARNLREEVDGREQLRVSVIDSVLTCTIPDLIQHFKLRYPDVTITLSSYHSLEAYQHIESGDLDAAIVGRLSHVKGAITYPIYSDPWVFICGRDAHYPQTVHPTDLDTSLQVLLCSSEADDWQEYWFSGAGKLGANKVTYFNKHLFEGETWAVLPRSIAQFLENTSGGVIRRLLDGPAPRMVYMVQSNRADSRAMQKFRACVYQEIQTIAGILPLFHPDTDDSVAVPAQEEAE